MFCDLYDFSECLHVGGMAFGVRTDVWIFMLFSLFCALACGLRVLIAQTLRDPVRAPRSGEFLTPSPSWGRALRWAVRRLFGEPTLEEWKFAAEEVESKKELEYEDGAKKTETSPVGKNARRSNNFRHLIERSYAFSGLIISNSARQFFAKKRSKKRLAKLEVIVPPVRHFWRLGCLGIYCRAWR